MYRRCCLLPCCQGYLHFVSLYLIFRALNEGTLTVQRHIAPHVPIRSGVPELVPADFCELPLAAAVAVAAVAALARRRQGAARPTHGRRRRRRLEARVQVGVAKSQ